MIYKKPDIKYVDMCIWIDKVVYTDQCDDVKLFEYLYHLINMLAHQGSYFKTAGYYDEFSLNGATRVFLRLKNRKQFEYDDNGEPVLPRIKSVLNYIKSILYPMKVVFEQQTYSQTSLKPSNEVEYNEGINFQTRLSENIDKLSVIDFQVYLHDVPNTCRAFLNTLPKKKNSDEWENLYLSCILTFLNSVTLNNKNKQRIQEMKKVLKDKPKLIDRLYKEERKDCIILFHLDESYRDYVYVIYNRIKHLLAKDLSATTKSFVPSEISAKNLIMSSLQEDGWEDHYNED